MSLKSIKKTASRRYSDEHLWFQQLNGLTYIGLTSLALEELHEVIFIEFPKKGLTIHKDDVLFVMESNKTSGDFISPVDGTVALRHLTVGRNPDLLNNSPEEEGWLCALADVPEEQFASLMTSSQYDEWLAAREN